MRKLSLVAVACVVLVQGFAAPAARAAEPIRVYLFSGQSNMVGAATTVGELPANAPDLEIPSNNVLFWGPTTDVARRWVSLEPPDEVMQNIFKAGFGPELSAGRKLAALHPGGRVAIIKYAVNGTNLYWDWNPMRQYSLYQAAIAQTRYAIAKLASEYHSAVEIAGFFWMQGESDSCSYAQATAYGSNLKNLIANVRHDLASPHLPVIVGQVADLKHYLPLLVPFSSIVRDAEWKVARADPDTFLVSTDGLTHHPLTPAHFDTRGTLELGRRFVQPHFGL